MVRLIKPTYFPPISHWKHILSGNILSDKMKKQNAVVARNYATQKYADTLIDKTNILNNKACLQ